MEKLKKEENPYDKLRGRMMKKEQNSHKFISAAEEKEKGKGKLFVFVSLFDCFVLAIPSKMILLFVVSMFVGCCAILWIYWNRLKKPPKKKIFISADCWLCVFDLLAPSQLGLGISMISDRFDFYVDEHFKTRKWTLAHIQIWRRIGENGTKKMEIANDDGNPLPIPQIQLPRKVIGFQQISINFIDRNAIAFLRRFHPIFAACPIHLSINTYYNDRILEFIFRNIWPMLGKNIHGLELSADVFHCLRQFVPSFLNDCPSLRIFSIYIADHFIQFPCDDNATASDEQALAKWLFTPLQSNVPKVFKCALDLDIGFLASNIEDFKAAFASASSPVNFIVSIWFPFYQSVVPFVLTNELTREQLTLKIIDNSNGGYFLLIRSPISRDESKWTKWEEEAIGWRIYDQWNRIDIEINDDDKIGDGLLDTNPGPSDQQ